MKVGDRVTLSKKGTKYWSPKFHSDKGVVKAIDYYPQFTKTIYTVAWDSDKINKFTGEFNRIVKYLRYQLKHDRFYTPLKLEDFI